MWQGIQAITDYKAAPPLCDENLHLLNELNNFFCRFGNNGSNSATKSIPLPDETALTLSMAVVRKTLGKVNVRKAAGPGNIPGRVLRECADQLAQVLTDIFNTSLEQTFVQSCFKSTTIIPVPKKSTITCLNDYRPVALTPIMMRCFERLVQDHIITTLPPGLDPYQLLTGRTAP